MLKSAQSSELHSTVRIPIFISKLILDIGSLSTGGSNLHFYSISRDVVNLNSLFVKLNLMRSEIVALPDSELDLHPLLTTYGCKQVRMQMLGVIDGLLACESLSELNLMCVSNFSNLFHCFRSGTMDSMSYGRLLELSFEQAGSSRPMGPRKYQKVDCNLMYAVEDTNVNNVNAYISSVF